MGRLLAKLLFFRIDFDKYGLYNRRVFYSYYKYRKHYDQMISDGWSVHNLSYRMGIIVIWFYKP